MSREENNEKNNEILNMIKKYGIRKIDEFIYGNENLRIFASDELFELMQRDKTLEQAINVSRLPSLVKPALVMPDGHQGYGFPIGGVAAFDYDFGLISPGGIGFDINCGVRLLRTNVDIKEIKPLLARIANKLYANVPSGLGIKGKFKLSPKELDEVLDTGVEWAHKKDYATDLDLRHIESNGSLEGDADAVSNKAKERGKHELGSLGSGNHFLEVQEVVEVYDEKIANAYGLHKGQMTIMIHTGSRGLGHQVATDYIKEMLKSNKDAVKDLPDKELIWDSIHNKVGQRYLKAMFSSANYAWTNRQLIQHQVRQALKAFKIDVELVYDVAHNIAKIEKYGKKVIVHRKGATRAFGKDNPEIPKDYKSVGQPVLIPGSMGTSSYVLAGYKAESISFGSSAHGAGRVMSRHKALKSINYGKLIRELSSKGISLLSRTERGAVEEAPEAYKDIDEVIKVTDALGIAKKVVKLKPVAVIKG